MSGIVCAIRGGPESRPTIERAVNLARKSDLPIYFLYVVNLDFLARTSSTRLKTIGEEMHQMGEFILLSAQRTAAAQGASAQGIIRRGKVRQEIIQLCTELDADYVIIGRPKGAPEKDIFTSNLLSGFIDQIERECGAQVILTERASNA